ncbi:hypothetical protein HY500_04485 [Candidatus Woesearchaeota archaeon]|nr:hypothetical protein [Candidatus Woesearchaeota archaeon]
MDKETWNKIKKDLNAMLVREKLLYLKEILKKVKEKELAVEISKELEKAQEIIDNEESPEETTPLRVQEPEPQRRSRETLEEELIGTATEGITAVNYGIVEELEKGSLYGREKDQLYKQKPYEGVHNSYETATQLDMMKEGERRLDSTTKDRSVLEQESINKKNRMYLR